MEFLAPAAGSVLKPAELEGHLLVVEPLEYVDQMTTQMGMSDAVRCTVHDITAQSTHEGVLWFSTVLVASLRTRIGGKVLGVMTKGVAKPGQTAPWVLQDASHVPEAVTAARSYLTAGEEPTASSPPADTLAAALNILGAKPVN